MKLSDEIYFEPRNKFIKRIHKKLDYKLEKYQKELNEVPKYGKQYFLLSGKIQAIMTIKEEVVLVEYKYET